MIAGEHASADLIARFAAEARSVAKLKHPGIVGVHEVGQSGSLHYLVMDYIEGQTLKELNASKTLTPRRSAEIIPGRPLHMVAAYDQTGKQTIIVTVYQPDPKRWEGYKRRKQ